MMRILTGIKPTGELHIGNYFSTIKPIIDLQDNTDSEIYLFVADLHSLTNKSIRENPESLRANINSIVMSYLSLGINTNKVIIYKQSDFPQITFLSWIFSSLVSVPYLQRSHAYKAAKDKKEIINNALMQYPILMASDILLPNASVVPVGQDQLQHIEISRDIARSFNSIYGDMFDEPEALEVDQKSVLGTDGEKMSKSQNNTIPIFTDKDTLHKIISKIKTSTVTKGQPLDTNKCLIFSYHKLFASEDELLSIKSKYNNGSIGYKESKEILVETIYNYFGNAHDEYQKHILETDLEKDVFQKNKEKLNNQFNKVIEEVKKRVGLTESKRIFSDNIMQ